MTEDGSTIQADDASGQAYQRVGEQLRSAREASGLSISDAGRRLNLAGSLIEDLENGRTDRMAGLYRRGYIRNYARALGLDPQQLLAEVEPDLPPELRAVMPAVKRVINLDRFFKIATYVVVSIAIIPPLIFFYVQSGSRMAERDRSVTDQALEVGDDASTTEQQVAQRISRALELDEQSDASAGSEPGHMSASVLPLAAGRPVRDPVVEAGGSAARLEPAADSDASVAPAPGLDLRVDVRDDSWVEIIAADGERLEYDLLRSGQSRQYSGQPPFRILLGRASSIDLVVGGRVVEYSGHDRGDVVELELLANGDARL